ncbi:hypothetical protein E1B28_010381 [Marasmius oreades]|uniref:Uncharacterized protein n=1 Tax=Marasmius oreades TaxID=181124 RepID=A0A9P7URF0_9AGAR|nr:uncharacterized protein E1B28_010381 [Marasmius oreades]KAG7091338.1 hypothetical protein E1B28_010381 [Marasmius oreades]
MPGIVFLLYLLAKTLARKQPIFLHIQASTFVFLDMDWTSAENPAFMETSNMLYPVGTSSSPNPRLQRLKTWRKELRITSLVMNPPDVADVVRIFTHAYPRSGLTAPKMENFTRLLIQTFNVDLCRFDEIFGFTQTDPLFWPKRSRNSWMMSGVLLTT